MYTLKTLVTICALIAGSSAGAAECKLSADSKTLTKPDGSTIEFVFGVHSLGKFGAGLNMINQAVSVRPLSKVAVLDYVRTAELENREHLRAMSDQAGVIAKRVERGGINWVGLEGLPVAYDAAELELRRQQVSVMEKFLAKGGFTPAECEYSLATSYTPIYWDVVRGVPWTSKTRIIGFDDGPLKSQYAQIELELNRQLKNVTFYDDREYAFAEQMTDQGREGSLILTAESIETILTQLSPVNQAPMRIALQTLKKLAELSRLREESAARVLLQQAGNGIVNMGSSHALGLSNALMRSCGK